MSSALPPPSPSPTPLQVLAFVVLLLVEMVLTGVFVGVAVGDGVWGGMFFAVLSLGATGGAALLLAHKRPLESGPVRSREALATWSPIPDRVIPLTRCWRAASSTLSPIFSAGSCSNSSRHPSSGR